MRTNSMEKQGSQEQGLYRVGVEVVEKKVTAGSSV